MTKEQLEVDRPLDTISALHLAFDAGCSFGIASHKDFVQIHEPRKPVCDSLLARIRIAGQVYPS